MYTKNLKLSILFLIVAGGLLLSCETEKTPVGIFENGVFIVNEGSFSNSNGSVSFYSHTSDSVINNIFRNTNNRSLGDVVQSLSVYNANAYIVVNNSNKIEIANKHTFEEAGVIPELPAPRYMAFQDDKGYVSCWGDNTVKVIDLNVHEVTASVAVSTGPEKMIAHENKLYVANSGGWGSDSIIDIINLSTETVIKSLVVKHRPTDMVINSTGDIWVLCAGKLVYGPDDPWPIIEETPSKLYKIDTKTDEVVLEATIFENQHPSHLEIDKNDVLYFGGGYGFQGIYSWDASTGSATAVQLIDEFAYGFNIDPSSDVLFVTLSPSFIDAGMLKRFDTNGSELGSYTCGIGPNGAGFKAAKRSQ